MVSGGSIHNNYSWATPFTPDGRHGTSKNTIIGNLRRGRFNSEGSYSISPPIPQKPIAYLFRILYKYATMKERGDRHEAIRILIADRKIESQEELRTLLESEGFHVTQATLSRDLKYLQVDRVSAGGDGYYYALREQEIESDLIRGWVSMDFSGNLGVIKTLPGHADSVAIAIDTFEFETVLGTVAGDDTIIVVLTSTDTEQFADELYRAIPALANQE